MEQLEFYDNGKYEKYIEVNGIKQGKATYYWGKNEKLGKIKEIFFYENGIKQGKAILYFDPKKTNKIKEEFFYENGIKQGESYLLYLDKLEKRNYINGNLEEKVLVYTLDGKAEVKNSNELKNKFKSFKQILGIEDNEDNDDEKISEEEYKTLKVEAEKIFRETAEHYKEYKTFEDTNIIPELFIKKYYSTYKNSKF